MKVTKNPAIAMGACICLLASVSSVKAVNENLLLYLSFDSGDREGRAGFDRKNEGWDYQRGRKDCSGSSRQSAGTGW